MRRSSGNEPLTLAAVGAALARCEVATAEQWDAALAATNASPDSAEIDPVVKHLSKTPAWWAPGEPALSSYQLELVREAFRHKRRPPLSAFRLSRYLLLEQLGVGGMAKVYRAFDLQEKRVVAVKRVAHASRESRLRFKRESKILKGLRHPGVNRFFGCHILKESALLVVEYVEGRSLAAELKALNGPQPWRPALVYMVQATDALAYAHDRGVLHRDIKPHNMQIARRSGQLVLLDFGLAKVRSDSEEEWERSLNEQTQGEDGREIGTPYYMSPEHWHGSKHVLEASDVYSLGCVFYEMLAGKPPFRGSRAVVIKGHCMSPRPSIREFAPDVPIELELLIQQMMAIRPQDRPKLSLVRTQLKRIQGKKESPSTPDIDLAPAPPRHAATTSTAVIGKSPSTAALDVANSGRHRVLSTASVRVANEMSADGSPTVAKLLAPSETPKWMWKLTARLLAVPWWTVGWLTLIAVGVFVLWLSLSNRSP